MIAAVFPVVTLAPLMFWRSVPVFTLQLHAVYFGKMKKNKHAKGKKLDVFAL